MDFWDEVGKPILFVLSLFAVGIVMIYFIVCALSAGDYRDVEPVGDDCVLVTEYTHVWYYHQNEITNQYTTCGEQEIESD